MNYKRLVPILLIKEGLLVRSQIFKYHQAIGDPIPTVRRLTDWLADEIMILNIGDTDDMDSRRSDKWHNLGEGKFRDLVERISPYCFCPLSVGGGIRSLDDIDNLFRAGADKCTINSMLFEDNKIIEDASDKYGKQALIASIDVKLNTRKKVLEVHTRRGMKNTGMNLNEAVDHAIKRGVGELLISSIDQDGLGEGYDELILNSIDTQGLPAIINSGAKTKEQFRQGLENMNFNAVAASNVFYFTELSYPNIKEELADLGCSIRKADLQTSIIRREPEYSEEAKSKLFEKQRADSHVDYNKYIKKEPPKLKYCTRCLYPSLSATPMQFDDKGVCMGCRVSDVKLSQTKENYKQLKQRLQDTVEQTRRKESRYDCIVSVSGGKDSYYQTYYVTKVLGLKALLVTYNGNNYTEVGWRNLWRMREVFDCDHIVVSPSVQTIRKLNKLAFIAMGDMNWHAHVGIMTTAPRIAVKENIPLIFWGEHGYADLCGQFSMDDYPEMNYRERTEHAARGFDWPFYVGVDGIQDRDMEPWKYPSDAEIQKVGLKQIYLGHYIPWESNDHLELMVEKYGFEVADMEFERTYRKGSNLDDMHENGVHDYMKYIKFGYGRCTDHASKDIRCGKMLRDKGIEYVNKMDHIKPKDLKRWLEYVDMSEAEFDRIADHFRDIRVWSWDEDRGWQKDTIIK